MVMEKMGMGFFFSASVNELLPFFVPLDISTEMPRGSAQSGDRQSFKKSEMKTFTVSGFIANSLCFDELDLSTYNGYRVFRSAEEARQEKGEVWRVSYRFSAEVNADGYLIVNGEGYGPADDESDLSDDDWDLRAAVIAQLPDTAWHTCQFVG